ncbi:MAG: PAS-domain containing protein [Sphingomonadales bacterium]|nr:PAS-domain containing protein [Sphingomonadales bacterium]MBD3773421.1 PAS-domain containing protein [Paracoccaceae bacterium]
MLFWIAHAGERAPLASFTDRHKRAVFGLSLAVYCTSWTFYGAVATAVSSGLGFLPIYLGPILMFLFFPRFIERVLQVGKAQHSTSIADFLSARYGKSAWVAALVTIIALFGALPYMALQLKSVSQTLAALSPGLTAYLHNEDIVLAVAAAMAVFAVLFGTGRLDLTQHNRGMVLAIAVEAVVKFVAIGAVAAFALVLLISSSTPSSVAAMAKSEFALGQVDARFITMTGLAAMAILCLPRQFHMLVVEAREDSLRGSMRWLFPVYLALICAAVVPVSLAGHAFLGADASADMLMISLPLAHDSHALALLTFIGGFSASTGMIIVSSIALSNMVTNDLIVPVFFRERLRQRGDRHIVGPALILIRRSTIVALLALAYVYIRSVPADATLAGLGEIAFAGAAQFAPGLLLGFAWRRANRNGMIAGLIGGFLAWLLLLAAPVAGPGTIPSLLGSDPLVTGTILSIAINLALFVLFSLVGETTLADRVQAVAFIERSPSLASPDMLFTRARVADFRLLLEQFVGEERARESLNQLRLETGRNYRDAETADATLVDTSERMITAIIGSSSAKALVQSTLDGDPVALEQVVAMFDETSQRLQFGAGLLQIAIENIDQGISVVDNDLRLVAWNHRYVEMFDLPDELVEVGRPIEDLLRFNMRALAFPEDTIDAAVEKRLQHLRSGSRHSTERVLSDGRVLRVLGNAAPNGGYVTSYTDITADRVAEQALEAKVYERTQQLVEANAALEAATRSKTRFLAAASHDLVQPMNAARLFASALGEEVDPGRPREKKLLDQIDRSIRTADRLLRALLDISRLDGGKVEINATRFSLDQAFAEIANEFEVQARAKGLRLVVQPSGLWLETDRGLFVSVLQNLVTNALRYSDSGKVLVGAKRRRGMAQIFVADQGRGICKADLHRIFEEFTRLDRSSEEDGLGLGLAIVRRIATMLGSDVRVQSEPGKGSCFSFRMPTVAPGRPAVELGEKHRPAAPSAGATILCVDNDPHGREALVALLSRWQFDVIGVGHPDAVPDGVLPELLVMDYRLDDGLTGDVASAQLATRFGSLPPVILLTAEDTEETQQAALKIGAHRQIKPANPATLRALINSLLS